jgi:hypothetical protein
MRKFLENSIRQNALLLKVNALVAFGLTFFSVKKQKSEQTT